ncbi:MAG: 1-deoxy-D-xylulose-5-phosphate reductoisomerase [Solobacterium sp.]|nr:1-deoxy-D-xylulose-5-phosphate reductoisomerase [Solobacterium sp.]
MKRLVLLGASGSIGLQTIDVVLSHPDEYSLRALGVGNNIDALRKILEKVSVDTVSVSKAEDAEKLAKEYPAIRFLSGEEALVEMARLDGYDVLVNALVGFAGFRPTVAAIESGHDVALANKETLVVGGEIVYEALRRCGRKLYPIDSEHSAIFQALQGNDPASVRKLIITASGGSFRNLTREQLKDVTVEQALAHPNWNMGAKITIDSADMMNKGFEVIEAHWLFDMDYDRIEVVMHDESVIHSMVEYCDGSIIAQMGTADMRLPIQYALSWPQRLERKDGPFLDLAAIGTLHFRKPDVRRFPLLSLAYEAGRKGGNLTAVMNAANEAANLAFRQKRIPFTAIEDIVITAVNKVPFEKVTCAEDLIRADAWGRDFAEDMIRRIGG